MNDKFTQARRGIVQALETLRDLIGQFERFGEEPSVGTVIVFWKQFAPGGRAYHYAALRTTIGWFLTGRDRRLSGGGYDWSGGARWEEVVEFIGDSEALIATGWQQVPTLNPDVTTDGQDDLLDEVTNLMGRDDISPQERAEAVVDVLRRAQRDAAKMEASLKSATPRRRLVDDENYDPSVHGTFSN